MHNQNKMKTKTPLERLTEHILEHESYTFSAVRSEMTEAEAEAIAQKCFENAVNAMIDGGNLDGLMISEELYAIREK